jgi:Ca-activated chloride channel family protein
MGDAGDFTLRLHYDAVQRLRSHRVSLFADVAYEPGAPGAGHPGGGAGLAEVLLLDVSASMSSPRKLRAAREAWCAAVDALPDGARFAIVAGTRTARVVFPGPAARRAADGGLAVAGPGSRAAARAAVLGLRVGGGTIIGAWLDAARELLAPHEGSVRHATLLTDGRYEHQNEAGRTLARVLAECRGVFSCDARGIGADWEPDELRAIATALHGDADAVPDLAALAADFRSLTERAALLRVPDAALRVRCAPGVVVSSIAQYLPVHADLAGHAAPVPGSTAVDFRTGPWPAGESRRYHVTLGVRRDAGPDGAPDRLAAIELVTGAIGSPAATSRSPAGSVRVRWANLPEQPTEVEDLQAHYRRDVELRDLRVRGGRLLLTGERDAALALLGRAVALATALDHRDALDRLARVVRIEDAERGVVRPLDPPPEREYVLRAMLGDGASSSAYTAASRSRPPGGGPGPGDGASRGGSAPPAGAGERCPECGRVAVAGARYCETPGCDHEFTGPAAPGAPG